MGNSPGDSRGTIPLWRTRTAELQHALLMLFLPGEPSLYDIPRRDAPTSLFALPVKSEGCGCPMPLVGRRRVSALIAWAARLGRRRWAIGPSAAGSADHIIHRRVDFATASGVRAEAERKEPPWRVELGVARISSTRLRLPDSSGATTATVSSDLARPVSSTRVSTETHAARSTSTKERKLTSPPSRRSFAQRSPSTVLASRNLRTKRSPKGFRP